MFAIGNLLLALANVVNIILTMMYWLILVRALISWVNPDPFNAIVQLLYKTTEPILAPLRRMLPVTAIDFSPILAFLLIVFLRSFLVGTIVELGLRLK